MNWIMIIAFYFALWFVVLFAMLPFGLRTQQEEGEVTLGTVASAPQGNHMWKVVVRTTLVTALIVTVVVVAVNVYGFGFDAFPQIVPTRG